MALAAQQALCVREYLTDHNSAQAAIRAGYCEKSTKTIASEHLTKPATAEEIARGKARFRKRLDVTAEKISPGWRRLLLPTWRTSSMAMGCFLWTNGLVSSFLLFKTSGCEFQEAEPQKENVLSH